MFVEKELFSCLAVLCPVSLSAGRMSAGGMSRRCSPTSAAVLHPLAPMCFPKEHRTYTSDKRSPEGVYSTELDLCFHRNFIKSISYCAHHHFYIPPRAGTGISYGFRWNETWSQPDDSCDAWIFSYLKSQLNCFTNNTLCCNYFNVFVIVIK